MLFPVFLGTSTLQGHVKIGKNAALQLGAVLNLNGSAYIGGLVLPNVNISEFGRIHSTFADAGVRG
jgi:hypothetical protein